VAVLNQFLADPEFSGATLSHGTLMDLGSRVQLVALRYTSWMVQKIVLWSQNCQNTETFTQLESPVVEFFMALAKHSFHGKETNSSEKSAPIPLLNAERKTRLWRQTCMPKYRKAYTEKFVPIPLLNDKAKYSCGVRTAQIQKILQNLSRWWLNLLWVSQW
jgi:hypothetical protein